MPIFHIVEARPSSDWVYDRLHALEVAVTEEVLGEDKSVSADWNRAAYADERTSLRVLLLALPGPAPIDDTPGRFGLPAAPVAPVEPLGVLEFTMPSLDNLHLVDDAYIQVRAEARHQGIGTALWREVVRIARAEGRDSIIAWSPHLAGASSSPQRVLPPTGVGHLPVDRATRFAQSLGLSLAQVERESRLLLPVDPALLARLRAAAEEKALPAYEVVSWVGPTPAEHQDRVAQLNRTLSTDAPSGDLDFQEEEWDAERVQHSDSVAHLTGHSVTTLAIHSVTGAGAGLTQIHVHHAHPHRPEQWNTVVSKAHRGHRLGQLIKVVNLLQLDATDPQGRYVETWNAGENNHMLAINTLIGFRLHSVHGAWQARLRS